MASFCLVTYKVWWGDDKERHGAIWAVTDALFVRSDGRDMTGSTLTSWLKIFQQEHGSKLVGPHALRHSNIALLVTSDVDIRTVSARVGHSDVRETLNIYAHTMKAQD